MQQQTKTGEMVQAYTITDASNLTMLPVAVIEYMEREGYIPPTIFKSRTYFTAHQVHLLQKITTRSIHTISKKGDLKPVLIALKGEIALSWDDLKGAPFYSPTLKPGEEEEEGNNIEKPYSMG